MPPPYQPPSFAVIVQYSKTALVEIPMATHCHFENPYDARCELVCGKVVPEGFALELQNTIRAQATRWVLQHAEDSMRNPIPMQ